MTAERLMEILVYDADTGVFKWRVRLSPVAASGSVAGSLYKNGRRYIAIDKKRYFASHLAWLYVTSTWPSGQIDHINMNRSDDRIVNLRLATSQQNSANRRVLANNKLGVKGVGISTLRVTKQQRFRARIRVNGRLIHLGYFSTQELAAQAYSNAAKKYFGEFARSA